MSAAALEQILDQLAGLNTVTTMNVSGYGEPMVHPLFYDFLGRAKEAGFSVEVVTNGLLLNGEAVERFIELELDRLIVSVDGTDDASSEKPERMFRTSIIAVADDSESLYMEE